MSSAVPNRAGTDPGPGVRACAPEDALARMLADPAVRDLASALSRGEHQQRSGSHGSSTALLAGALAREAGRPVLLIVAHLDEADDAVETLSALGVGAARFPALEMIPGETHAALDLLAERVAVQRRAIEQGLDSGTVLAAPIQALMQAVPKPDGLERLGLRLAVGDRRDPHALADWLDGAGYERVETIEEPGQFAVRGGIVDLFPAGAAGSSDAPVRLDFFGDEVESIAEIDLDTMGSDRRVERVEVVGARAAELLDSDRGVCFAAQLPKETLCVIHETTEVVEQARGYYERVTEGGRVLGPPAVLKSVRESLAATLEVGNLFSRAAALPVEPLPAFASDVSEAMGEIAEMARTHRVVVYCQNAGESSRLSELIEEFAPGAPVERAEAYLHRGFVWTGGETPLALAPYHEILHRFHTRRRARRIKAGRAMDAFVSLEPGDYVVHVDQGIARFVGLVTLPSRSAAAQRAGQKVEEEYLTLEFDNRSRLHVPAAQIDKVQKYVGGFKGAPKLSTLGGKRWKRQKEQVAEATRDLAAEMLRVSAARESMPGVRYPRDTAWQVEFEAEFPYEETEDQLGAMAAIKRDMQSPRPMDRLVCGDVGFGKTELAIRAAFKAVEFGKQVAVLVPTTVLAEQHERTFRERFAGYPFGVESLSRFKTKGDQRKTLERAAKGQVDVLIGTHRLLSGDVRFADLGLLIVDEEQRFGVEHKQRLLELRATMDVLTLSATPIPRTLHMALLGLRDISSLTTPPMDRRSIVTEVLPWNEQRIKRALERELAREGQVFFVHNRVKSIHRIADDVRRLAPGARVVVGHGQMTGHELERVMLAFVRREADVLVCTTIIESGIDIPTANTMLITDADRFGLADLHQLRGRVGRHKHRAYCYLMLPVERTVTPNARKRLKAIEEYAMLGAGFKIAMRDLEIRGAGNLLGPEQSGHIAAVGYELYCRLLEDAVRELKEEAPEKPPETTVELGLAGLLPKPYIPSDVRRMEVYRRVSMATSLDDLARVRNDLADAYGDPPRAAQRLLDLAELRVALSRLGVRSVAVHEPDVIFRAERARDLVEALGDARGTVRVVTTAAEDGVVPVYYRPPKNYLDPHTLLRVLRQRLVERPEPAPA